MAAGERSGATPASGATAASGATPASGAEHVDAVVVGSGFGGSVAAYRLAEAGRSVVVLERGKAYPPGSFPTNPAGLATNLWDPSAGLHGMFDLWTFRGLEAVVSSGLGGGSLIYANVLLRKDERWFVHDSPLPGGGYENWPVSRADLDPHYDAVERMMQVQRYPFDRAPYDATAKTRAMRDAAARAGLDWSLPPLAVSFAPRPGEPPVPGAPIPEPSYGNIHGRPRRTCRLCGECDIGCNDGAKNTLDHTYLSAAAHHGADIRTRHEVRGFAPREGGGYEVRYVVHEPASEGRRTRTRDLPVRRISCDRLVLAAGTLGTSWLLLTNRSALPGLSRALGQRFSGNGDLLTVMLRAREDDGRHRPLGGSHGPVITSAVRIGDAVDGDGARGRGHYVEDAGYPGFVDWLVESTQVPGTVRRSALFALHRLRTRLGRVAKTGVSAEVAALIGRSELSDGSLPLLGMGRDVPDGVLGLHRGYLGVQWTTTTSEDYFEGVRSTMRTLARALRADYKDSPLWLTKRVVTVHPLGGAPMGRHVGEGVCDSYGEVFGFPGLYVADGALVPGPVGPNPSLTIAALADRMCERALQTEWRPAVAMPRQRVEREDETRMDAVPERPEATSLSFTEEMKGFVELGVADCEEGERRGRAKGQRLMFHLTITADDVERFVADPAHEGRAVGWVDADVFGGRRPVTNGVFNLFTVGADPNRRRMLYRLPFADAGGNPLTLVGHKDVHDDPGLDVWRDTSTLYTRILAGHVSPPDDATARVVAAGVITIHLPDFLRQLTTFRTEGPDPAGAYRGFGRLFLGQLWEVYGERLAGAAR